MSKHKYKSTCHQMIDGVGHVWPDDDDGQNRKVDRTVEFELTDNEASRYGGLIKGEKVADDPEPERDKQVKGSGRMK